MVELICAIEYFTVEEFAAKVRVTVSTIERWIDEGKIKKWQVGKNAPVRIPVTELERHLK